MPPTAAALPCPLASWWLLPCASQQQARRCPTQPDFHWLPPFSSQQLRIPSDSEGSTSTLGLLACPVYTAACHGGICTVARRPPVSNNTAVASNHLLFFISLKIEWQCLVFSAAAGNGCPSVRFGAIACLPPQTDQLTVIHNQSHANQSML